MMNVNEMTTLELINDLSVQHKEIMHFSKTPTAKFLRENCEIHTVYVYEDNSVATVFKNGYVLFESSRYPTVMKLSSCKSYTYSFADGTKSTVDFLNVAWPMAVFSIGNARIAKAADDRQRKHGDSVELYSDNENAVEIKDPDPYNDPQNKRLISVNEELIRAALNSLTLKQKNIVIMHIFQNISVTEIAHEMGCSHPVISKSLKSAMKKLSGSLAKSGISY